MTALPLFKHRAAASLVTLGLVLLTGVGGMTSFGQAAFCGFAAYTSALLTTRYGYSPWLALPIAASSSAGRVSTRSIFAERSSLSFGVNR